MQCKKYQYYNHEADIGIQAWGNSIEEAFSEGTQAMLDLISNDKNRKRKILEIEIQAQDLEMLWIEWLNRILAEMDIRNMIVRSCKVKKIIKREQDIVLIGEIKCMDDSVIKSKKREVKAATYCQAKVEKQKKGWMVRCVLDL